MPEDMSDSRSIAPYVALLGAHIDLVSDTSEDTAMRLSKGLAALRQDLLDLAGQLGTNGQVQDALDRASDLQGLLQTQDILRQQVVAVRDGLASLSGLETDDVSDLIGALKDRYVMPQQWEIHAQITGERDEDTTGKGGSVFF